MGGILGYVRFRRDGKTDEREEVARMRATLAHRERPGGAGWSSEGVAVASQAAPVVQRGDLVFVGDVRLDAVDELSAALGLEQTVSDGELVLRAYERFGADVLERLYGDFAFVILSVAQRRAFCARDPFGVKPFAFHHSSERFLFASEPKALLALDDVPDTIDELRVGSFLAGVSQDQHRSFHAAIARLPAAHLLEADESAARVRKWYALDPSRELPRASAEEFADEFGRLFRTAVRARVVGQGRVGSALSGGLDSSSVACAARDVVGGGLPTFSTVFEGYARADERVFIDSVVATGGFEPVVLPMDGESPLAGLDEIVRATDGPVYAANLYLSLAVYRAARQHGVEVLLEGLDGDTVVGHGNTLLVELALRGRFMALAREVRAMASRTRLSKWKLLKALVVRPVRDTIRPPRPEVSRLLGATTRTAFAERIGLDQHLRDLRGTDGRAPMTVRAEQAACLQSGLFAFSFETLDPLGASLGVSPGFPFFDRRLVEFCLALPADMKLRNGWGRYVLRLGAPGLPDDVRWRTTKGEFGPSLVGGLQRFEGDLLSRPAREEFSDLEPFVDLDALESVLGRIRERPRPPDVFEICKLAGLRSWLRGQVNSG